MIFAKTINVPATTPTATPLVTPWHLASGLIYKVEIYFPPGPCGLVGVAVQSAIHRLYPFGESEWFIGDNVTISFDDEMSFNIATKQVEIWTYNLDEKFAHSIQVRMGLISDPLIIKNRFGVTDLEALTDSIGNLVQLLESRSITSGRFNVNAGKK